MAKHIFRRNLEKTKKNTQVTKKVAKIPFVLISNKILKRISQLNFTSLFITINAHK